ncbi:MAG: rhodanese-like domain-containing protein [Pirellulales bacterium]
MRSLIILNLAIAAVLSAPALVAAAEHTKDSLDVVQKSLADKKAVLLDVREPKEWEAGHLQDAQTLPLSQLSKSAQTAEAKDALAKQLPPGQIVYTHCARGVRAVLAADILEKLGYDVRALKPGFEQLRDAGFPAAPANTPADQ